MDNLDPSTAEGSYKIGVQLAADGRYEEALIQLADVRNRFPYSQFTTDAELKIADIHFERESFVEAQNAYLLFKDFHPKHPRIDYATSQLALSYFHQLPDTIDRDLSQAQNAISAFDDVIRSYPGTEYAKKAKEKRAKIYDMLAQKELYIADFYFKQKQYLSALGRYEDVLRKFPDRGLDAKALYGAAISAKESRELDRAKSYAERLLKNFPKSQEAKDIQGKVKL